MPPTPEQTKAGYANLWNRAKITPDKAGEVKAVAQKIIANKAKYLEVEDKTGVPWFMIGPIHNRESSLRFNAHLHCGTPLTARTTLVPKGRPKTGHPPFTWEESAFDALTMAPHSLDKVKSWTVERILYETERYNGWGYLGKGNSPYVWAGTSEYNGGKYIRDHVYDPRAWDKQLGCAALLKQLAEMDPGVALRLARRQAGVPSDLRHEDKEQDASIRRTTNARNGAAGGAAASGGTKATVDATAPTSAPSGVTTGIVLPVVIGIFIAVAIVAAVMVARKRQEAKKQAEIAWRGPPTGPNGMHEEAL